MPAHKLAWPATTSASALAPPLKSAVAALLKTGGAGRGAHFCTVIRLGLARFCRLLSSFRFIHKFAFDFDPFAFALQPFIALFGATIGIRFLDRFGQLQAGCNFSRALGHSIHDLL